MGSNVASSYDKKTVRVVPGWEYRISNLDEKGFDLTYPIGFDSHGEEKALFKDIHVALPCKLPPASEWKRLDEPFYEHYKAGDTDITFKWIPPSVGFTPRTFCNVVVVGPEATPVSSIPGDVVWSDPSVQRSQPRTETTFIANLNHPALPSAQMKVGESRSSTPIGTPMILIEGGGEDEQFVRHAVTMLTAAVNRPFFPISKYGFAPFGLNNSLYFGHTFWDMDMWVLPSMLFLQPEAVRGMNKYRLDRAAQAEKNATEFFKKPNSGMMFPWESSVSGKETVPGPSQKEHHISGSVLWGLNLSDRAGIVSTTEVGKVANGVSRFFEARSVAGPNGREIKDVMSPDESHIGDNDLYTNLLAQWAMNGRKWEGTTKFKLPKDDKSFLTYDNDQERGYKQAAAVLSIFPLQYPEAEKQARTMMERFEGKVSKNGPAMSDAIHATIWARLGEKQKAYDAWKRAWEPFVKGPQMMFSEKRSSERTYFYTGAAGCLNTVLYGFAGFRFDEKPLDGAVWKKQVKSGWWLSCKPCLPPKWKSLTINPMVIDGQNYSVEITPEKVNIRPSSGA